MNVSVGANNNAIGVNVNVQPQQAWQPMGQPLAPYEVDLDRYLPQQQQYQQAFPQPAVYPEQENVLDRLSRWLRERGGVNPGVQPANRWQAERIRAYATQRDIGQPIDRGTGRAAYVWEGITLQHFSGGRDTNGTACLVADSQYGTFMVRTGFLDALARPGAGWAMGAPIEDEHWENGRIVQRFERAQMAWSQNAGVTIEPLQAAPQQPQQPQQPWQPWPPAVPPAPPAPPAPPPPAPVPPPPPPAPLPPPAPGGNNGGKVSSEASQRIKDYASEKDLGDSKGKPHLWNGLAIQDFGGNVDTNGPCGVVDGPRGPHLVKSGFYKFYTSPGTVQALGAPLDEEHWQGDRVVQNFEKAMLVWVPGKAVTIMPRREVPGVRP